MNHVTNNESARGSGERREVIHSRLEEQALKNKLEVAGRIQSRTGLEEKRETTARMVSRERQLDENPIAAIDRIPVQRR